MRCIAQITDGKVLKSNGVYQKLSTLKPGDHVMNMYGKPVVVKNVIHKGKQHSSVLDLKSDNWYTPLKCSEELNILTWDMRERKPKWLQAEYVQTEIEQFALLPTQMSWELPATYNITVSNGKVITPSNELGFLIGAYLRIGYQKDVNVIGFHCDTSKKIIADTIIANIKDIFGVDPKYRRGTFTFDLDFDSEELYNIFEKFRDNKSFPEAYYCLDKMYIQGINDGMVFSGTLGNPSLHVNPQLFEVMYWSSLTTGRPLNYGQLKRMYKNVPFTTSRTTLYNYNRYINDKWILDVECETGSFIINNMIVRND
jgi:hypothetical protein